MLVLSAFVRVPDVSKERALSPLLALDLVGEMDGARFIPLGGVVGTMACVVGAVGSLLGAVSRVPNVWVGKPSQ